MKSIALIVDVKNWAFDIQAQLIKKSLKDEFKIDIFYSKHEPYNEDIIKILDDVKNYDIIHFFWRKTILPICDKEIQRKLEKKNINIEDLKKKISTGIYDHLFLDEDIYNPLFNDICKKYVTSSKKLYEIYRKNKKIKDPYAILGDTFDEKLFFPKNLERFKESKKSLVIGWVGNSSWNNKLLDGNGKMIDFKGFHTILSPVIEELKNERYNIETYYADKNVNFIPNNKMCDYFNKIDVYVCASISEGTPRPLIEAMGCGVPIITTDIGVAKQYFGAKQKRYIISERKIGKDEDNIKKELKEKIIYLYKNRKELEELSQENYNNSKAINNSCYNEKYRKYFSDF
ncbi:MAG: glycosyltransferase family 4 protein [Clostridia bacterium]|nr:glycosyltransferase family 4 protein [Clostridia bacterium]